MPGFYANIARTGVPAAELSNPRRMRHGWGEPFIDRTVQRVCSDFHDAFPSAKAQKVFAP